MPLDADKYSTCPITQWHINVEEYESDFKKYFTGNLISLWFYSCKILRRELKMDPTAPNIIFYFFWNEFLLAYNGKKILERNAFVNTYSIVVRDYITCFKIISSARSSAARRITCTLISSTVMLQRVIFSLPQPTKLHLMCSENIIKEVLEVFSS